MASEAKEAGAPSAANAAGRAYAVLRVMAMDFRFGPGAKINEAELAEQLNVSRTPLREALHRLASERLVLFSPGQGFRARTLDTKEVFDLYETRLQVELAIVDLACQRATPDDIAGFDRHLDDVAARIAGASIDEIVAFDEQFHELIAASTGNEELVWLLRNVNARLHFTRWISTQGAAPTDAEHRALVQAIRDGNRSRAADVMRAHIGKRLDQVVEIITEGHARLYRRTLEETGDIAQLLKKKRTAA
ncbi:GntR family transcriptional regulator [Futiania mangrovi]|uniref:GntR family transcriptional regulator n=1 Tax=Futiania mangrovi TaxID=2959716 RepID=A0A9J6PBZ4_9PROT|nr:GntR family transcriptional regulator [Futiania mangrovii]MCP1335288.1 GntR family transcriptional regulator [Futiania mangrovii]